MGIFDTFRRKDPIDPTLKQAVKDYQRNLTKGAEEAMKSVEAIFGGLTDQEVSILEAAKTGLMQVPLHLANRLDLYLAVKAQYLQMKLKYLNARVVAPLTFSTPPPISFSANLGGLTSSRTFVREPVSELKLTSVGGGLMASRSLHTCGTVVSSSRRLRLS